MGKAIEGNQKLEPTVKQGVIVAAATVGVAIGGAIFGVVSLRNDNAKLRGDLRIRESLVQSNAVAIEIQAATIQSYQVENAKLSRQIASIELERDPSAKALKKRIAGLAGEIFAFLSEWRSSEPGRANLNGAWLKGGGDDFSKAFMEHADSSMSHDRKMALAFAAKFVGRLTAARDQLGGFGIQSELLDKIIHDQVRVQSEVQAAAEELQKLAEKA